MGPQPICPETRRYPPELCIYVSLVARENRGDSQAAQVPCMRISQSPGPDQGAWHAWLRSALVVAVVAGGASAGATETPSPPDDIRDADRAPIRAAIAENIAMLG